MIDATTLKKLREDCRGMHGRFFYDAERGDIAYIAAECEACECDCEKRLNADCDQDCSISLEDWWGEEHICEPIVRMLNAVPALLGEVERLRALVERATDELSAAARWIGTTQYRVDDDAHKQFAAHIEGHAESIRKESPNAV